MGDGTQSFHRAVPCWLERASQTSGDTMHSVERNTTIGVLPYVHELYAVPESPPPCPHPSAPVSNALHLRLLGETATATASLMVSLPLQCMLSEGFACLHIYCVSRESLRVHALCLFPLLQYQQAVTVCMVPCHPATPWQENVHCFTIVFPLSLM